MSVRQYFRVFGMLRRQLTVVLSSIDDFVAALGYTRSSESSPWAESKIRWASFSTFCHLHALRTAIATGDSAEGNHVQKQAQIRFGISVYGPKVCSHISRQKIRLHCHQVNLKVFMIVPLVEISRESFLLWHHVVLRGANTSIDTLSMLGAQDRTAVIETKSGATIQNWKYGYGMLNIFKK